VIRGRPTGDKTEIDLIFANVNAEDILLREDLDQLAKDDKSFRVHYVLNNPPENWEGGVGFVTPEMITVRIVLEYGRSILTSHRNGFLSPQLMSSSCFAGRHL
jgi:NAD(P)H-flavin reductase